MDRRRIFQISLAVLAAIGCIAFFNNGGGRDSSEDDGNRHAHLELAGAASDASVSQPLAAEGHGTCKKLLWFMSMIEQPRMEGHWEALSVAMMSAKAMAPSLQPVLLYLGQPSPRTAWFEAQGGIVIHHDVTFKPMMETIVQNNIRRPEWLRTQASWARLDVPCLKDEVLTKVDASAFDDQHILYTDVDVLFYGDVSTCSFPSMPSKLMVGPLWEKGAIGNTGVALLNAEAMCRDLPDVLEYAQKKQWRFRNNDQDLLLFFYKNETDLLPDELNWKASWGTAPGVAIVHHTGAKAALSCTDSFVTTREVPTGKDTADDCNDNLLPVYEAGKTADNGDAFAHMVHKYREYVEEAKLPAGS